MKKNSDNFVDVVGFQFEKIHTGVIAWLLDSERSPLDIHQLEKIARRLGTDAVFPEGAELEKIKAKREYSFDRSLRIDLVLELEFKDHPKSFVLIECKTDSDVRIEQLKKSEEKFLSKKPGIPYSVTVLALGAGQCTLKHQLPKIQKRGFHAVDLKEAVEIFSKLPIAPEIKTYHDWIASLQAESERTEKIFDFLSRVDNPWDASLIDAGYRWRFPIYYLIYNKLRDYLEEGPYKNWAIYSGSNNPVMSWDGGTLINSKKINLFWEFNDNDLCLKAELTEENKEFWEELRQSLIKLCASCPITGKETNKRRGTWVKAYKWGFNFCEEKPQDIIEKIKKIIGDVHPRLKTLGFHPPNGA